MTGVCEKCGKVSAHLDTCERCKLTICMGCRDTVNGVCYDCEEKESDDKDEE